MSSVLVISVGLVVAQHVLTFRLQTKWGTFVAMPDVRVNPKLIPIVDSLVASTGGRHDAKFVRDLVYEIASQFDDAPVQDYLEVLVTKEAAERLRRVRDLQPTT